MQRLNSFLDLLATRLLGDVSRTDLTCLVRTSSHPPLLTRYRAEMIISRVRLVSAMFAFLTPLWIIIDYLVFATPLSIMLGIGRLLTTLAFAALALSYSD